MRGTSGGSGGGAGSSQAVHRISGNQVDITARVPMAADPTDIRPPLENVVTIMATGGSPFGVGSGGRVNVVGNQGVRVTAGPPVGPLMAMSSESTNGIELIVGEAQSIALQQGLPEVGPSVQLAASGLTIDGGMAPLTIQSMTSVTIQVAGGLASITLSPAGVEIKGLLVNVN